MDASESETGSGKSRFIGLITELTIRATCATVQAAYFNAGKGSVSDHVGSVRLFARNLMDTEIKVPSRVIEEMKGKIYTYKKQIEFKLQFW
jgi:hypothetical protein